VPAQLSPKAIRSNQEFFDLLAGDIFGRLYHAFPEPIDLHTDGVFSALGNQQQVDDSSDRLKKLHGHAVQWLADEGYLRFSQAAHQDDDDCVAYFGAVLTSKGLDALRKIPQSLTGPGETLGEKIEAAAKEISTESAKILMKQLVPLALGYMKSKVGLGN
jgi:hypothetical protein